MRLKWRDGIQPGNRYAEHGAYSLVTWPSITEVYFNYTIHHRGSEILSNHGYKTQRAAAYSANMALARLMRGE